MNPSAANNSTAPTRRSKARLSAIAPGILVAATGVGAGDLITAGVAGSRLGVVIAWAALAGGVLKWFLNEGIARWQMATGTTLLEGWTTRLGRWIQWVFLIYLLAWTFITAGALASACGAAGSALLPLSADPISSKILWGVIHSLGGLALVWIGGFRMFEKLMSACIALMFVTVILTAVCIRPDWAQLARGLVIPKVPAGELSWVLGVLGGVGGTLTLLCYGYWIREEGREGEAGIRACRIDLAFGYTMTALFGVAMIVIGSRVEITGGGARVASELADRLKATLGESGRIVFLIGFWGAVFSSLLGVWQSVPYLFADFLTLRGGLSAERRRNIDYKQTAAYRWYLIAMATIPLVLLSQKMILVQQMYAVFGALFVLLLALTLLIMNNRRAWVGRRFRSGWLTNAMLAGALLFFLYQGAAELWKTLYPVDEHKSTRARSTVDEFVAAGNGNISAWLRTPDKWGVRASRPPGARLSRDFRGTGKPGDRQDRPILNHESRQRSNPCPRLSKDPPSSKRPATSPNASRNSLVARAPATKTSVSPV